MTTLLNKLEALITPVVADHGLRTVRLTFTNAVLQLLVEPVEAGPTNKVSVNADQCASLSRELGLLIDVEELIESKYTLEVSSPGINRPLVTVEDFNRYQGVNVKVVTLVDIEGDTGFKGKLASAGADSIVVTTKKGDVTIPLSAIKSAAVDTEIKFNKS